MPAQTLPLLAPAADVLHTQTQTHAHTPKHKSPGLKGHEDRAAILNPKTKATAGLAVEDTVLQSIREQQEPEVPSQGPSSEVASQVLETFFRDEL